ncbi:MAG: hypothetical protein M1825_005349 [Sarcosagium campestre]|nr:MAG: hypothetical protein M1825_005349 [Sarcosagium campestre]
MEYIIPSRPLRPSSTSFGGPSRSLRILLGSTGHTNVAFIQSLAQRFSELQNVVLEGIVEPSIHTQMRRADGMAFPVSANIVNSGPTLTTDGQYLAHFLVNFDLLLLAPMDVETLGKMLYGGVDNLLLKILRSWDVSKRIFVVPGMSESMLEHPLTKKQLGKIQRKLPWISVFPPIIFSYPRSNLQSTADSERPRVTWDGSTEIIEAVKNQAELKTIGQDGDIAISPASIETRLRPPKSVALPPEIWTTILDYLGDWEMAQALNVYTTLPVPAEWQRLPTHDAATRVARALERTLLTGTSAEFIRMLQSARAPKWLSRLMVKLIIKFEKIDLLSYLVTNQIDLFRNAFTGTVLPTKASAFFGKITVLNWWRKSPFFTPREYSHEAIDGASKAGFVHILDWWRNSGLELRYSEAALEQASSKGHIAVLEWWRRASVHQGGFHVDPAQDPVMNTNPYHNLSRHQSAPSATLPPFVYESGVTAPITVATALRKSAATNVDAEKPLRLKVGKSLLLAAQAGRAAVLRWWATSGIPMAHEDAVARHASAHGHVEILRVWRQLRGDKMHFDSQVLVGATKNGHSDVLEWWRSESGFAVEYKTCDIEEALEDSLGGEGEERVRAWWERNGLNLGVGTSEWMMVKTL